MNAALYLLPFAQSAAQVGTAVLAEVGDGLAAAGASFAEMLTKATKAGDERQDEKASDQVGSASSLLNLIEQIQSGLQARLQSMGLQLDGDLSLTIDAEGKVAIAGDSDSAAVLEQVINSDPALQSKMAALTRACKASGAADRFEAQLRYRGGELELQPSDADAETAPNSELPTA